MPPSAAPATDAEREFLRDQYGLTPFMMPIDTFERGGAALARGLDNGGVQHVRNGLIRLYLELGLVGSDVEIKEAISATANRIREAASEQGVELNGAPFGAIAFVTEAGRGLQGNIERLNESYLSEDVQALSHEYFANMSPEKQIEAASKIFGISPREVGQVLEGFKRFMIGTNKKVPAVIPTVLPTLLSNAGILDYSKAMELVQGDCKDLYESYSENPQDLELAADAQTYFLSLMARYKLPLGMTEAQFAQELEAFEMSTNSPLLKLLSEYTDFDAAEFTEDEPRRYLLSKIYQFLYSPLQLKLAGQRRMIGELKEASWQVWREDAPNYNFAANLWSAKRGLEYDTPDEAHTVALVEIAEGREVGEIEHVIHIGPTC